MKQITSGGNWLFNWSRCSLGVAQISAFVIAVSLLGSCNEGKDASPSSKGGVSSPEMTPLIAKVVELSADLARVQQESLSYQRSAETLAKNYEQCEQINIQLTNAVKLAEAKATDAFAAAEQRQRELTNLQVEKVDIDKLLATGTSRADILKRLGGPSRGFHWSPTRASYQQAGEVYPDNSEGTEGYKLLGRDRYMWLNQDGSAGRQSSEHKIVSTKFGFGASRIPFERFSEVTFEVSGSGQADADFVARHLPSTFVSTAGQNEKAVSAYQWDGYLVYFDAQDRLVFWCRPKE